MKHEATNELELHVPNATNADLLYLFHMKFYMTSFRPQNSLSEYTMDFALNSYDQICSGLKVYHAGLAGKLGCLKLKKIGLLCMLKEFATIYTLTECTSDLVLSKHEKASGILVHYAGVAVKVTFYMVKFQILFKIILSHGMEL